jgi:hypothetical protein
MVRARRAGRPSPFIAKEEAVGCRPFHPSPASVGWSSCSLRVWLNDKFFHEAFDEA